MVVCNEGGEMFMILTQWKQRKPKWPTHKDLEEKKNAQQRNIANGAK